MAWCEIRDENAGQLRCSHTARLRNCALVTAVGAHGAHDLDGKVDALAVQNDYPPSYVDGHNRWETFRRTGHGLILASTGCGPVAKGHEPPPAPNFLVNGPCSG